MSTSRSAPTRSGSAVSTVRSELLTYWIVAAAWSGMFGTFAVLILMERIQTTALIWDRVLVALALLGPVFLWQAARESARAWRFRHVSLDLDPPQGSLGGELGGFATVPMRHVDAEAYRVAVSCVHVTEGSDSTRESVIWSREVRPVVRRVAEGVRLEFAVSLPEGLPQASRSDGGGHRWVVRVTGTLPGLDLDAAWDVPVLRHDPPRVSSFEASAFSEHRATGDLGRGLRAGREGGALVLHYGVARSASMGLALIAFGVLCVGSGSFIFWGSVADTSWSSPLAALFTAFGGVFLLVFGIVGLLLVTLGTWLCANTLRVELEPRRIRTRRRFLVFSWERELAVEDVERIEARVVSQVGGGAKATVGYEISAVTAAGRITLGDGIRGPGRLDRISLLLEREIGCEVEVAERRSTLPTRRAAGVAASEIVVER